MGLRRQAREIAEEPQDTRRSLPVRITATGRVAASSGPTVQPGTKFRPFDRRDIVPVTLGPGILNRSIKEPAITRIPKMVVLPVRPAVTSAPVIRPVALPQKEPAIPPVKVKVKKMGLDLGAILNTGLDLYSRYESIKSPRPVAVAAPVSVAAAAPVTSWPGAGYGVPEMAGPQFIANTPGGGIPFGEFIAEPPPEAIADGMKGWAYKKSCGEWKWIKSRNRRRRKLLTDSDYNGLLKLQTLKVNSNMNIAIAKSIGR